MTQIDVEIKHADGRLQRQQLSEGSYLVGRELGDIVLGDPDVSARHAEISIRSGQMTVTDLGSSNGTLDSAGRRLESPRLLAPGESLRFGSCTLTRVARAVAGGTQLLSAVPSPEPAPAAPSAVNARLRGKVIKVPDQTAGLLIAEGRQLAFTLEGVWQSPVAPAPNQVVEVELSADGAVATVTVVAREDLVKEQLRGVSEVAQLHTRRALSEAKRRASEMPEGSRKKLGLAAAFALLAIGLMVWLAWPSDPADRAMASMERIAHELSSNDDCADSVDAVLEFTEENVELAQDASTQGLRSPQLEAERRYPERFAAAQKKYAAGMFKCSNDKAFRKALTDQASSSTALASFARNRTRKGAGFLTSEPSTDSLLLGAAGVLGGVTLMLVAMGLLAGAFWLWMLIDTILFQSEDKVVWMLVVFFFNLVGAGVYYFLARKKRRTAAAAGLGPA